MKKTFAMLLLLVLLLTLASCSGSGDSGKDAEASGNQPATETGAIPPGADDQSSSGIGQTAKKNALVVYFSCTGHTEAMAHEIARQTGAELYEIVPKQPYTDEDISYQNDESRANREMNDDSARPAISEDIGNLADYDTLYIGYPIWWGTMPKILNTFYDTYDLSGKTILPFCTSGGSGIAESVAAIMEAEPQADVKDGLQINSSAADSCADQVAAWLKEVGD